MLLKYKGYVTTDELLIRVLLRVNVERIVCRLQLTFLNVSGKNKVRLFTHSVTERNNPHEDWCITYLPLPLVLLELELFSCWVMTVDNNELNMIWFDYTCSILKLYEFIWKLILLLCNVLILWLDWYQYQPKDLSCDEGKKEFLSHLQVWYTT